VTQRMSSYPFAIQIFQLPSVVMMTISATRMYRSLTEFASDNRYMYEILPFKFFSSVLTCCRLLCHSPSNNPSLPNGDREASVKWNMAVPADRIKVTVNSTTEQFQVSGPSRMSHHAHHDPCMSADEQLSEKPHRCEAGQEPGEVV
jgi:hypothetical protein